MFHEQSDETGNSSNSFRVTNDFHIELEDDGGVSDDYGGADMRVTIMGLNRMQRSRDSAGIQSSNGVRDSQYERHRFRDEQRQFGFLKRKDETDGKREIIIQKLTDSGVSDPLKGKPELQKTMKTLESEYNSIPEHHQDFS